MLFLLNFGDKRYRKSQQLLIKSAMKFGVNKCIVQNQYNIFNDDLDFVLKNRYVFRQKKGYGYWLWKPFIIDKMLNNEDFKSDEGNILFYCDSGVEIIAPLDILLQKMSEFNQSVLPFHINHINLHYVKKAIFEEMKISKSDIKIYQDASQCCGGYMFFKNDNFSRDFVREWLILSQKPFLIDDVPTPQFQEEGEFIDNRHDQAIFSMLVKKYNLKTLRDPSQYGNNFSDRDFYQVFKLHRKRIHPWFKKEKFPFYYLWKNISM